MYVFHEYDCTCQLPNSKIKRKLWWMYFHLNDLATIQTRLHKVDHTWIFLIFFLKKGVYISLHILKWLGKLLCIEGPVKAKLFLSFSFLGIGIFTLHFNDDWFPILTGTTRISGLFLTFLNIYTQAEILCPNLRGNTFDLWWISKFVMELSLK